MPVTSVIKNSCSEIISQNSLKNYGSFPCEFYKFFAKCLRTFSSERSISLSTRVLNKIEFTRFTASCTADNETGNRETLVIFCHNRIKVKFDADVIRILCKIADILY